jgi:hypothetical protein
VITIPQYDYKGVSKKFRFSTYFKQPEVLDTLKQIRDLSLQLQEQHIFTLPMKKTTTLDEFENIQTQSIEKLLQYFNDM